MPSLSATRMDQDPAWEMSQLAVKGTTLRGGLMVWFHTGVKVFLMGSVSRCPISLIWNSQKGSGAVSCGSDVAGSQVPPPSDSGFMGATTVDTQVIFQRALRSRSHNPAG